MSVKPEKLDVVFRAERSKPYDVTAVFPSEPGTTQYDMTCYGHVGQHGCCSMGWYNATRKATPAQYADLLTELRSVYAPEYVLVVKARITAKHRKARAEHFA